MPVDDDCLLLNFQGRIGKLNGLRACWISKRVLVVSDDGNQRKCQQAQRDAAADF